MTVKHILLWFHRNPKYLFNPILWKHIHAFRKDVRYDCQRKFCICNENLIFRYLGLIENGKPMVSTLKPILRHQKQCKHAFDHFIVSTEKD